MFDAFQKNKRADTIQKIQKPFQQIGDTFPILNDFLNLKQKLSIKVGTMFNYGFSIYVYDRHSCAFLQIDSTLIFL